MKNIILSTFLTLYLLLVTLGYLVGAKPLIVTSNSMSPSINKGDIVVALKKSEYKVDDIISFKSKNGIVTHRLAVKDNGNFITKGDANQSFDSILVSKNDVLGKVELAVPFLGFLFMYLQSKYFVYLLLVFVVYLLLEKVKNVKK